MRQWLLGFKMSNMIACFSLTMCTRGQQPAAFGHVNTGAHLLAHLAQSCFRAEFETLFEFANGALTRWPTVHVRSNTLICRRQGRRPPQGSTLSTAQGTQLHSVSIRVFFGIAILWAGKSNMFFMTILQRLTVRMVSTWAPCTIGLERPIASMCSRPLPPLQPP